MHRGITKNLSLAGWLFILLTALSALLTPARTTGGVYYYDENGVVLWYSTGDTARTFVVRTTKNLEDIYGRTEAGRFRDGSPYQPVKINSLSPGLYDEVINLIKGGFVHDSLVIKNIVEVENVTVFKNIIQRIPDDGRGDTMQYNNREYGGMIKNDNSVLRIDAGERSFPCAGGAGVRIYGRGKAEFHSHPSGTVHESSKGCAYIQPPSKIDQDAVEGRRGYVLGMSSKLIYIYDSTGLNATLPFAWFRRN
jgi:hypothetical protein